MMSLDQQVGTPAMTHMLAEAEHTLRWHDFSMVQLSRDEGQTTLSGGEWQQVQQSYLLAFLRSLCYTREKQRGPRCDD